MRTHGAIPVLVAATALACGAANATGAWPDDPAVPLVLGATEGIGETGAPVVTTTGDGATWVAWVDGQCFGELRVQRIAANGTRVVAGGVGFDERQDCLTRGVRIGACTDGTTLASGIGSSLADTPVQRVAGDGTAAWDPQTLVAGAPNGAIEQLLGLPGGDALLAGWTGQSIFLARHAPDGTSAWGGAAIVATVGGANKRIFALVPDDAGGAHVLWDEPLSYVRVIYAMRVTGAGAPAWAAPVVVMPGPPQQAGSSRHTDPVAVADGANGVVVVWTQGAESAQTPVPLRAQRLDPGGTLRWEPEGRRVALAGTRQFDADVCRDAATGDLLVAWRDGGFTAQTLRAQRLTLDGTRQWGDDGVAVAPLGTTSVSRFDAVWGAGTLRIAVADAPVAPVTASVRLHRVSGAGSVAPDPWSLSGGTPAGVVRAVAAPDASDAVVVTWTRDLPGFPDEIVAQRIRADGMLGPALVPGDLDGNGVVGFADLNVMLALWGACPAPCAADLDGNGTVGLADLSALLAAWS